MQFRKSKTFKRSYLLGQLSGKLFTRLVEYKYNFASTVETKIVPINCPSISDLLKVFDFRNCKVENFNWKVERFYWKVEKFSFVFFDFIKNFLTFQSRMILTKVEKNMQSRKKIFKVDEVFMKVETVLKEIFIVFH